MPWSPVVDRDRCQHQPGAQRLCRKPDWIRVADRGGVGKNYIDPQARKVTAQSAQMVRKGQTGGLLLGNAGSR